MLHLIVFSVLLKLLLVPSYKSTDFEVHRNWLAITNSLPLNQWYIESTSQWTLDYPPFFAYFEYILSIPAAFIDPKITQIDNLEYSSQALLVYHRMTVIVSEMVLVWAVYRLKCQIFYKAMIILNAGLLLVDHIHFQYNGVLLGILLHSIIDIEQVRFSNLPSRKDS